MKAQLIQMVIGMVLKQLSGADLKKFADMALDFIEDKVEESPTQYDDALILPTCKMIRDSFGIEDND